MSVKHKEMFGITEEVAKEILDVALSTGGEFAEVYMELTSNEAVEMLLGKVSKVSVSKVKGAAIRIIKEGTEVNCSLTKCNKDELLSAAKTLSESFEGNKVIEVLPFVEREIELVVNPKQIRSEKLEREIELLSNATKGALEYNKEIVQVMANIVKKNQNMFVFASDGTWQTDHRCNNRISCQAIASDGVSMQPNFGSFGRNPDFATVLGLPPVYQNYQIT